MKQKLILIGLLFLVIFILPVSGDPILVDSIEVDKGLILNLSDYEDKDPQVFGIQTEIEDTDQISLDLLSQPDMVEKEIWLNWTLRLTVLEWNPDWTTVWDHPSLIVLVKASDINFTEYNNVSFGLNRTTGWASMSITCIHYLHVFTSFDLGNLTDVTTQDLIVGVNFADDMPSTSYTLDIHIYDSLATTTTTTTTTDTTTTDTTDADTTTTSNGTPVPLPIELILAIGSVIGIVIIVVIVLAKRK